MKVTSPFGFSDPQPHMTDSEWQQFLELCSLLGTGLGMSRTKGRDSGALWQVKHGGAGPLLTSSSAHSLLNSRRDTLNVKGKTGQQIVRSTHVPEPSNAATEITVATYTAVAAKRNKLWSGHTFPRFVHQLPWHSRIEPCVQRTDGFNGIQTVGINNTRPMYTCPFADVDRSGFIQHYGVR